MKDGHTGGMKMHIGKGLCVSLVLVSLVQAATSEALSSAEVDKLIVEASKHIEASKTEVGAEHISKAADIAASLGEIIASREWRSRPDLKDYVKRMIPIFKASMDGAHYGRQEGAPSRLDRVLESRFWQVEAFGQKGSVAFLDQVGSLMDGRYVDFHPNGFYKVLRTKWPDGFSEEQMTVREMEDAQGQKFTVIQESGASENIQRNFKARKERLSEYQNLGGPIPETVFEGRDFIFFKNDNPRSFDLISDLARYEPRKSAFLDSVQLKACYLKALQELLKHDSK